MPLKKTDFGYTFQSESGSARFYKRLPHDLLFTVDELQFSSNYYTEKEEWFTIFGKFSGFLFRPLDLFLNGGGADITSKVSFGHGDFSRSDDSRAVFYLSRGKDGSTPSEGRMRIFLKQEVFDFVVKKLKNDYRRQVSLCLSKDYFFTEDVGIISSSLEILPPLDEWESDDELERAKEFGEFLNFFKYTVPITYVAVQETEHMEMEQIYVKTKDDKLGVVFSEGGAEEASRKLVDAIDGLSKKIELVVAEIVRAIVGLAVVVVIVALAFFALN